MEVAWLVSVVLANIILHAVLIFKAHVGELRPKYRPLFSPVSMQYPGSSHSNKTEKTKGDTFFEAVLPSPLQLFTGNRLRFFRDFMYFDPDLF